MSKQEKSYTYFCSYLIFMGEEKMYSSKMHTFPQRITSHQAVRAAERQIAGTIEGVDPKALRLICLHGVGEAGKKVRKKEGSNTHPYFVSYVASLNGNSMVGNTVLDLDYDIQIQPDIDAIEEILREKKAEPKFEKLRLLNFAPMEG